MLPSPTIKHTVPWRVTAVTALPDARLRVTFVDGTSGEVEMDDENGTGWFSFRICTWVEGYLTFELSCQSSCTGEGTPLGGFLTGRTKCAVLGL